MSKILAILCLTLVLSACAHRSMPGHLNYLVDGKTCQISMRMVDCDSASPPNCRQRLVTYDRGCEKLVAPQVTK